MEKKTKLTEKATRIPDIRETKWAKIIPEYFKHVRKLNTESARSHRFSVMLNDLFGIQPGFIEDYVSGIEKYIKVRQKDRILKGRVDNGENCLSPHTICENWLTQKLKYLNNIL